MLTSLEGLEVLPERDGEQPAVVPEPCAVYVAGNWVGERLRLN